MPNRPATRSGSRSGSEQLVSGTSSGKTSSGSRSRSQSPRQPLRRGAGQPDYDTLLAEKNRLQREVERLTTLLTEQQDDHEAYAQAAQAEVTAGHDSIVTLQSRVAELEAQLEQLRGKSLVTALAKPSLFSGNTRLDKLDIRD